jgi:hypothetical protein
VLSGSAGLSRTGHADGVTWVAPVVVVPGPPVVVVPGPPVVVVPGPPVGGIGAVASDDPMPGIGPVVSSGSGSCADAGGRAAGGAA